MLNKNGKSLLIAAVLALLALGASACDSLPTAITQRLPAALAPATNTPTPTSTPLPAATPAAPQARGKAPNRAQALQGLAALLKGAGLQGGVVTSNDGSALGVKLGKATAQLQVASNAMVVVPAKSNATLSDIAVGDRVIADVTGADPNASATFLLDFPANYTANNLILGAVMPDKSSALNLLTRGGKRAVTTSAATTLINISGDSPALESLSGLQPGNAVLVIGSSSGNAFDAQVVIVLDQSVRGLLRKAKPNPPQPTPTPDA